MGKLIVNNNSLSLYFLCFAFWALCSSSFFFNSNMRLNLLGILPNDALNRNDALTLAYETFHVRPF